MNGLLLQKLKHYTINRSYLRRKSPEVNIKTNRSKTENVLFSIQQGSNLGLLLVLTFIDYLPICIGDATRYVDVYADDTTLYDIGLDKDVLEMCF